MYLIPNIKPRTVINPVEINDNTLVIMNKTKTINKQILVTNSESCKICKFYHDSSLLFNTTCNNNIALNNFINLTDYISNATETLSFTPNTNNNEIYTLIKFYTDSNGYIKINNNTITKNGLYLYILDKSNLSFKISNCEVQINMFDKIDYEYDVNDYCLIELNDNKTVNIVILTSNKTYYSIIEYNPLIIDALESYYY